MDYKVISASLKISPLRQRQPLHVGLELFEILLLFEAQKFEEGMEFGKWVLHKLEMSGKEREDLRNEVIRASYQASSHFPKDHAAPRPNPALSNQSFKSISDEMEHVLSTHWLGKLGLVKDKDEKAAKSALALLRVIVVVMGLLVLYLIKVAD